MSTTTLATAIATDGPTPTKRMKRGISPRVRTAAILTYLLLALLAIVYIYPFLIAVAGSFKTDADATNNPLSLIPQTWSFAAFERLFTDVPLPRWALLWLRFLG